MKTKLLLTLAALALAVGPTFGAEGEKKKAPVDPVKRAEMMLKSDEDKDGKLSKAEFGKTKMAEGMKAKGGDEAVGKAFDRIDKDKDGFLTKEELSAPPAPKKPKP